jgi:hypothetical protein
VTTALNTLAALVLCLPLLILAAHELRAAKKTAAVEEDQ